MLAGMKSTGLLTCLKHFPGQGHADIDTHKGTAVVDVSEHELMKRELFPFVSLHKVAPMVMVSHCIYSHLDSQIASMSRVIMTELLREKVGFQGVIVTDDMTMGAIPSDTQSWKEAIVTSVAAGADLVLVCEGLDKWQIAIDALRIEASRSKSFDRRLNAAASRVSHMRQTI
jgi:beta-N-acetylhexosaminidase